MRTYKIINAKKMRKTSLLLLSILMFCCDKFSKNEDSKDSLERKSKIVIKHKTQDENFEKFYNAFITDSIFQISRIKFPLEGRSTEFVFDENYNRDTICKIYTIKSKKFYWNKDGWVSFKGEADLNDFSKEVINNENLAKVKYKSKNEDFTIFLEFIKINNKWYLHYYSSE